MVFKLFWKWKTHYFFLNFILLDITFLSIKNMVVKGFEKMQGTRMWWFGWLLTIKCQNCKISNDLKKILDKTTSAHEKFARWDELHVHVCTRGDFESKIVHSIVFSLDDQRCFLSTIQGHKIRFLLNFEKIWAYLITNWG